MIIGRLSFSFCCLIVSTAIVGCAGESPNDAPPGETAGRAVDAAPEPTTPEIPNLEALATAVPLSSHKFQLRLVGDVKLQAGGEPESRITSDTNLAYAWTRTADQATLTFHQLDLVAKNNGVAMLEMSQNRERMAMTQAGQRLETRFEEANPQLRAILGDTFDTPIVTFTVNEHGDEVGREMRAGPGAQASIENGAVANAQLCHPPFPGTRSWKAPCQISAGNGNYARGTLEYEIRSKKNNVVQVHVAGQAEATGQQGGLEFRDSIYKVDGTQTYDLALREWTGADLSIDIVLQLFAGDQRAAEGTGTLKITMAMDDAD